MSSSLPGDATQPAGCTIKNPVDVILDGSPSLAGGVSSV